MSDFDLYPGQNCRCGNDPMCHTCGSGAAYEAQIEQEEAYKQAMEEAYKQAMEEAYSEHLRQQQEEHHAEIMRGIAAGNLMEPMDDD